MLPPRQERGYHIPTPQAEALSLWQLGYRLEIQHSPITISCHHALKAQVFCHHGLIKKQSDRGATPQDRTLNLISHVE